MYRYRYIPRSLRKLKGRNRRNLILTIILGIFIIYFLFTWGLPALIGGLSFFNRLKPAPEKKEALEETIPPPVLNIPFEATSSATIKISGYSSPNSKVEIYVDDSLQTVANTSDDGSFQTESILLSLGTNNIYGQTILGEATPKAGEAGKKSFPSKTIRLIYSNEKPKIEVTEPKDGQEIKGSDKKVKVLGRVEGAVSITVNEKTLVISSEGRFQTEIGLNEGENIVAISASNQVGNSSKLELKVIYTP